jgi:hypothetical protein
MQYGSRADVRFTMPKEIAASDGAMHSQFAMVLSCAHRSSRENSCLECIGRPSLTVPASLVRVFPSGETVSMPELSGRFGAFNVSLYREAPPGVIWIVPIFISCAFFTDGKALTSEAGTVREGKPTHSRQLFLRN